MFAPPKSKPPSSSRCLSRSKQRSSAPVSSSNSASNGIKRTRVQNRPHSSEVGSRSAARKLASENGSLGARKRPQSSVSSRNAKRNSTTSQRQTPTRRRTPLKSVSSNVKNTSSKHQSHRARQSSSVVRRRNNFFENAMETTSDDEKRTRSLNTVNRRRSTSRPSHTHSMSKNDTRSHRRASEASSDNQIESRPTAVNTRRRTSTQKELQPSTPTNTHKQREKRKSSNSEVCVSDTTSDQSSVDHEISIHSDTGVSPGEEEEQNVESIQDTENDNVSQHLDEPEFKIVCDPEKPTKITARLISDKCLSQEQLASLSKDEITDQVLQIKRINLENCNIWEIDNLECYDQLTHLELQHNHISEVPDQFIFLPELLFLALFNNKIKTIENLNQLSKLQFLDISDNQIQSFNVEAMPLNIQYLNMKGNPFCSDSESYQFYRRQLIKKLPKLVLIDNVVVSQDERISLDATMDAGLYAQDCLADQLALRLPSNEIRNFEQNQYEKSSGYEKVEQRLNSVRFDRTVPKKDEALKFQQTKIRKMYSNLHTVGDKLKQDRKERLMSLFSVVESKLQSRRDTFQKKIQKDRELVMEKKNLFQQQLQEELQEAENSKH